MIILNMNIREMKNLVIIQLNMIKLLKKLELLKQKSQIDLI